MTCMKRLREERGISMKAAATALDLPYTTYVNYEKGNREPNLETLIKIADFYNTSIDYLLCKPNAIRIDDDVLDKAIMCDDCELEKFGNLYQTMKFGTITNQNIFANAVQQLQMAIQDYQAISNSTMRDGVIKRFELTFGLAWKSLKEYMADQGVQELQLPKQIIKIAYTARIIDDENIWLNMLSSCNITSHIYDDAQASKVIYAIQNQYIIPLQNLVTFYTKRDEKHV